MGKQLTKSKLIEALESGSAVISPQFRAVLEPMFDIERTTDPSFDRVGWMGDTLMGVPPRHIGFDAFIGWCSKSNFERNLKGLCEHLGDDDFDAHMARCMSFRCE